MKKHNWNRRRTCWAQRLQGAGQLAPKRLADKTNDRRDQRLEEQRRRDSRRQRRLQQNRFLTYKLPRPVWSTKVWELSKSYEFPEELHISLKNVCTTEGTASLLVTADCLIESNWNNRNFPMNWYVSIYDSIRLPKNSTKGSDSLTHSSLWLHSTLTRSKRQKLNCL